MPRLWSMARVDLRVLLLLLQPQLKTECIVLELLLLLLLPLLLPLQPHLSARLCGRRRPWNAKMRR